MAWNNKQIEQAQEQWNARVARKRLDLSVSVEEALRDNSVQEDLEPVETDHPVKPSQASTLIPPRLSLQSKSMPAVPVHIPSTNVTPAPEPPAPASERQPATAENSSIFSRFASRFTSSLTSFSGKSQPATPAEREGSSSLPKGDEVSSTRSASHAIQHAPGALSEPAQTGYQAEVSAPARTSPRFAGHNTKVRLQVVPRPEEMRKPEEGDTPLHAAISPGVPAGEKLEKAAGTIVSEPRAGISGAGLFESGQSDRAVANANITPSSVVVVMLASDPGPVVVQYVTLQPGMGFTVHLSAPAKNTTPFNYTIL